MGIKMKVIFHKSDDGVLHETAAACAQRNACLKATSLIQESLSSTFNIDGAVCALSVEQVSAWAIENAAVVVPLLAAVLPPKQRATREPGATRKKAVRVTDSGDSAPAVIAKAMESSAEVV